MNEGNGSKTVLECIALMININYGNNKELMQNCRKLYEYVFFAEAMASLYDGVNEYFEQTTNYI